MARSTIDTYLEFHYEGGDLVKATKHVRQFGDEGKKASSGVSILDISLGNLAANGIQSLISGAGQAVGMLVDFGAQAAEIASDARETESLLNNALGPAYEEFAKSVDAVGDSTGRSTREFKQSVAPILAMTKAQGFAADQAANMSVQFGQAALDLNSYFNSATGFEDLQSALAGSSETLQKYGIDVKEGALQQAALNMGLVESLGPLDTATRTTVLLAEVQRQAADAMGDATRTAGDYANVQRALTDEWRDFKGEVGDSLVTAIAPAQKQLLGFARDTLPEVAKSLDEVIQRTVKMSKGIVELGERTANSDIGQAYAAFDEQFRRFEDSVNSFGNNLITGNDRSLIENLAEERIAQQELEAAILRVNEAVQQGAVRMGTLSEQRAKFTAIDTSSFDAALQNSFNTSSGVSVGDAFGNFETSTSQLDAFFGTIDANTQTSIDNVQAIGSAFSGLREQIEGLGTTDILGSQGNAESNAFDLFTNSAQGLGLGLQDQAQILQAAGLAQAEIDTRARDILEQTVADYAAAFVQAGNPVEEALQLIADFQAQIDSADNPIDLAIDDTLGLQSALAELGNSTFTPSISFQVDTSQLDEALDKLESVTGFDSPVRAVVNNSFVSDSIEGNRGRAR